MLRDEREQVNGAERELREAEFAQRECRNKLQEMAGNQRACAAAARTHR
jgi:hypothetical protein